MIAIVDGGSTKCDWVILESAGNEILRTTTSGFNPNIIGPKDISAELEKSPDLVKIKDKLSQVYFYGSGCGVQKNRDVVTEQFQNFFPKAKILVREDLIAAAYAGYNGKPAIICILGTGSNSCYFDGKGVRTDLPSLGFLIGDEGSGSAMGKLLLKKFFMKKLPPDLHDEFVATYHLTIEEALANMYHNPRANAYVGEYNKFIAERKDHPYFENLIFDEMKNFLDYQVLPYPESKVAEINFIGYIAYIYEDFLRAAAAELNLKIGVVVRKPIDNLVDYHREYILPKIES